MTASYDGNVDIVVILMAAGADVNAKTLVRARVPHGAQRSSRAVMLPFPRLAYVAPSRVAGPPFTLPLR